MHIVKIMLDGKTRSIFDIRDELVPMGITTDIKRLRVVLTRMVGDKTIQRLATNIYKGIEKEAA